MRSARRSKITALVVLAFLLVGCSFIRITAGGRPAQAQTPAMGVPPPKAGSTGGDTTPKPKVGAPTGDTGGGTPPMGVPPAVRRPAPPQPEEGGGQPDVGTQPQNGIEPQRTPVLGGAQVVKKRIVRRVAESDGPSPMTLARASGFHGELARYRTKQEQINQAVKQKLDSHGHYIRKNATRIDGVETDQAKLRREWAKWQADNKKTSAQDADEPAPDDSGSDDPDPNASEPDSPGQEGDSGRGDKSKEETRSVTFEAKTAQANPYGGVWIDLLLDGKKVDSRATDPKEGKAVFSGVDFGSGYSLFVHIPDGEMIDGSEKIAVTTKREDFRVKRTFTAIKEDTPPAASGGTAPAGPGGKAPADDGKGGSTTSPPRNVEKPAVETPPAPEQGNSTPWSTFWGLLTGLWQIVWRLGVILGIPIIVAGGMKRMTRLPGWVCVLVFFALAIPLFMWVARMGSWW